MRRQTRDWLADVLAGAVTGGIVGAVVAVNVVIYSGIEPGYEASLPEVFRQSPLIGVVTVGVLAAGPVTGVVVARRFRGRRKHATQRRNGRPG